MPLIPHSQAMYMHYEENARELESFAVTTNENVNLITEGGDPQQLSAAVVTQRVRIESAYRQALKRLAGSDPGRDPSKWAAWLAAQRSAAQRGAASSQSQR